MTLTRVLAPAMKEAGGRSIVFIGSQSMHQVQLPQAGYGASKGAPSLESQTTPRCNGSFPMKKFQRWVFPRFRTARAAVSGQSLMVNGGEMMR